MYPLIDLDESFHLMYEFGNLLSSAKFNIYDVIYIYYVIFQIDKCIVIYIYDVIFQIDECII